jgi:hypothetical protein
MKELSQRYLVASVAFVVAAIWTGLSVTSAFECLIAFTFVYAIAGAAQRGKARIDGDRGGDSSRSRSRRSHARPPRFEPSRERSASLRDDPYDRPRESSRRSGHVVYDLDRHSAEDDWARVADSAW